MLPISTRLFYGFGSVAYGVKDNGFSVFLLLYYNQVLGLPERWVGLAILIALVADALSDPVVGHVSDHLHSRWGRRHPFLYASALPVAVSYFFLWNPPPGLSQGELFAYLLILAILIRTFITFYEVPSSSLVPELTANYDERTSILGLRYFFGWWGGLSMAVLAYAVFLRPDAEHPVGILNPEGWGRYGLAAALIMFGSILVSAIGTHPYIPRLKPPPPSRPFDVRRAIEEFRESLSNRSFLALFAATVFAAMASGLGASLNLYVLTYFWELTSGQISVLTMAAFASAAIALVAAPAISRRMTKKRAAIMIAAFAFVIGPAPVMLRLAGFFPPKGSPALVPLLGAFYTVYIGLLITASILAASMVADVVEDSETSTGRRSEGIFFASLTFVGKCVSGLGVFLATVVLWIVGFPSGARPGEIDLAIVTRLALVFVPVLALLHVGSLVCLLGYRIDRAAHEENLRRLAATS